MTTGEKIEANANLALWCIHILGPDEVYAAPSYSAAKIHAHEMNKALHSRLGTPNDVLCFAYAAPWPYGATDHAKSVKNLPITTNSPAMGTRVWLDAARVFMRRLLTFQNSPPEMV